MNTFIRSFRTLALLALAVGILLPAGAPAAQAQSSRGFEDYFRSYARSRDADDDDDDRRSYSRERYSSAIQREIRKLDEDPVEDLPIPVLLGLARGQIHPDFGDDRDGGDRTHEGQDLIAPRGAYVVSPTDAVVTRTGTGASSGIYVYTMNPGGESFRYMHLDGIADGVKAGTVLAPGSLIGYVGDTGNAKGGVTHLHFEIRDGREAIDPYPRLTGEFSVQEKIRALTQVLKALQQELKDRDS